MMPDRKQQEDALNNLAGMCVKAVSASRLNHLESLDATMALIAGAAIEIARIHGVKGISYDPPGGDADGLP